MGALRVFLDANVLFSAALGGPSFGLLWDVASAGKIRLFTSAYCRVEAERNLRGKAPAVLARFAGLMQTVTVAPDPRDTALARALLPEKDAPVYAAALAAQAHVLLTGDRRHFGRLMERNDLPLRVRTVRAFLTEGPGAPDRQS